MGLDGVELIMRVERDFAISISDEEAGNSATVGQLYQCVLGKVCERFGHACLTSHAFYRIRKTLIDNFGLARRQVRPDTPLAEAFPPGLGRRAQWFRFGELLGLKLPALVRPNIVENIILFPFWAALIASVSLFFISAFRQEFTPLLHRCTGGLPLSLGWIVIARMLTRPLAISFPRHCASVGDLALAVFGSLPEPRKEFTAEEVWPALKAIIVDELGVKPEEVVPEARFYEDLNVD